METATINVLVLLVTICEARQTRLRVIQGVDDVHNEFPFVVSLQIANLREEDGKKIFFWIRRTCTGTLIAHQWVLTAAHCIDPNLRLVKFGNMTIPTNRIYFRKILEQIPHPSYKDFENEYINVMQNDIALILIQKLTRTSIGKVSAVDYKTLVGRGVRYAGFGNTFDINYYYEDEMEQLELDKHKPLQLGEGVVVLCSHNALQWRPGICVTPTCSDREQYPAYGDSGGPLFFNGRIIGIVSGWINNQETIYTPVSLYLSWLNKVISETKE